MSSVDKRVVQMDFDDSKFQEGAKRAAKSLEDLDQKLILKNGTKGLEQVQNTARSFNMSNVSNQADEASSKFSIFGKKALSVLGSIGSKAATVAKIGIGSIGASLAALGGMSLKGGYTRALNLEQANFQLKNLLKSSSEVNKVMENVSYAVDGTRYGLDAAAKAAGQLAASNVKAGDEMKTALRGISGVAAMTNSEYEDISRIFTRVAGNGRLFAIDLNSIASRGINAAAALGKELGKTEAEIRDMTTKGKIDFQTFARAMDNAFGESSKKANETFQGALANTKAALSRIGAELMVPGIENARKVLVETIPALNQVKKSLVGVGDTETTVYEKTKKNSSEWNKISKEVEKHGKYVDDLGNYYEMTGGKITKTSEKMIQEPVEKASKKIKNELKKNGEYIDEFGTKFYKKNGKIYKEYHKNSVFRLINTEAAKASKKLSEFLSSLTEGGITSKLTSYVRSFSNFFEGIKNIFDTIGIFLKPFKDAFLDAVSPLFDTTNIGNASKDFLSFTESLKKAAEGSDFLKDKIQPLAQKFGEFIKMIVSFGGNVSSKLSSFFGNLFGKDKSQGTEQVDKTITVFEKFKSLLDGFRGENGNVSLFDGLNDSLGKLLETVKGIGTGNIFGAFLLSITVLTGGKIVKRLLSFSKGIDQFKKAVVAIPNTIKSIPTSINHLSKSFKLFSTAAMIFSIALSVRMLASSLAILASIPFVNLISGIGGVALLLGVLIGAAVALDRFELEKPMAKVSNSLLKLSASLFIVSIAVSILGSMEWESLAKAGVTLLGLIAIIAVFSEVCNTMEKPLMKASKVFGSIGFAVMGFVGTVKMLGSMSLQELGTGILGLTAILALLLATTAITSKMKTSGMLKLSASLLILAAAMLVLVPSIMLLSSIPFEQIIISMASLALGLALIGAASILLQKGALGLLAFSAATLIFGAGLLLISIAALAFTGAITGMMAAMEQISNSSIDIGKVILTFLGLSVALIALLPGAIIMAVISLAAIALSAALIIGAIGVTLFTGALGLLLNLNFSNFADQMKNLGEGLAALEPYLGTIVALTAITILFGIGMIAAGAGILIFLAALKLMEFINFDAIAENLISAASRFGEVGAAIITGLANGVQEHKGEIKDGIKNAILGIKDIILGLAGDFLSWGKDIVGGILGGMLDAVGLGAVADAVGGVVDGIGGWLHDALGLPEEEGKEITNAVAEGVKEEAPEKSEEAGNAITDALTGTIGDAIPDMGDLGIDLGDSFGGGLGDSLDGIDITSLTEGKLTDMTSVIDSKQKDVKQKSGNLGTAISDGAAKNIKPDKMKKKLDSSINDVISSGKKKAKKGEEIGKSIGDSSAKGAGESKKSATKAGENIGQGLIDGIKSKDQLVYQAGYNQGKKAVDGQKKATSTHSPSRIAMETGGFIGLGLYLGMMSLQEKIYKGGYSLGESAVFSLALASQSISKILDDVDTDPVIRPVLDLTDLESGVNSMNGLIPSTTAFQAGIAGRGYGLMASAQQASSVQNTNNYTISLDYNAGDSANDMVRAITQAIRARDLMEG